MHDFLFFIFFKSGNKSLLCVAGLHLDPHPTQARAPLGHAAGHPHSAPTPAIHHSTALLAAAVPGTEGRSCYFKDPIKTLKHNVMQMAQELSALHVTFVLTSRSRSFSSSPSRSPAAPRNLKNRPDLPPVPKG